MPTTLFDWRKIWGSAVIKYQAVLQLDGNVNPGDNFEIMLKMNDGKIARCNYRVESMYNRGKYNVKLTSVWVMDA